MLSETVGQRAIGTFTQVPSVLASTSASAYGTEMVFRKRLRMVGRQAVPVGFR